jgi:hypothetical protein
MAVSQSMDKSGAEFGTRSAAKWADKSGSKWVARSGTESDHNGRDEGQEQ